METVLIREEIRRRRFPGRFAVQVADPGARRTAAQPVAERLHSRVITAGQYLDPPVRQVAGITRHTQQACLLPG